MDCRTRQLLRSFVNLLCVLVEFIASAKTQLPACTSILSELLPCSIRLKHSPQGKPIGHLLRLHNSQRPEINNVWLNKYESNKSRIKKFLLAYYYLPNLHFGQITNDALNSFQELIAAKNSNCNFAMINDSTYGAFEHLI